MSDEAPSARKPALDRQVLLGRIHGAFGVRGEVKLESFAEPARGILRYQPWTLRVPRSVLPPPAPGEYYWVDLEGLRVVNVDGTDFGTVSHLFATGANDVLVAQGERERMIPFLEPQYVRSVDFDAGVVTVDWDPEF